MPPRVYIPLSVHDDAPAAPRSPRGLGAVVRAGLISEDDGPPEWREKIFESAWWYRWSSFAYCLAGGMLVVRPAPMYRHAQPCCGGPRGFPFRSMGVLIFVNGLLSYMSDTHIWLPECVEGGRRLRRHLQHDPAVCARAAAAARTDVVPA